MLHDLLKTIYKEQTRKLAFTFVIPGVCLQCYATQCHWLPAIQVDVWSQSTNCLQCLAWAGTI